jgi:hypothetical protein
MCVALVAVLIAAGAPCAQASDAPPPLPSLRHLTFAVDLGLTDEYEKRMQSTARITLPGTRRSTASAAQAVPQDQRTSFYDRRLKGTIVCDVVAATSDGGLVVDISEEMTERVAPRMRVAIAPNGHLSYPPTPPLFEEEVALLRLLARSVVGAETRDIGSSWTVEDNGKGYGFKTTYHVVAHQTANDLRLDLNGEYHQDGLDNLTGALQGKLAYDQSKLVPVTASLDSQARRETPDGYRVVRMAISLMLVEDSFGRR